jgi:pilus assembly protein Flp/PilA
MRQLMRRFINDRSGATAIEYAMLVSLLAVVIAGALTALGTKLYAVIGTAATAIH